MSDLHDFQCRCSRYDDFPCYQKATQEDMLCDYCRARKCRMLDDLNYYWERKEKNDNV